MKKIMYVLIVLLMLTSTFVFVGCGGGSDSEETADGAVIVTYYITPDSKPYTVAVFDGVLSFKAKPEREYYTFLGLFDAPQGGTQIVNAIGQSNIAIESDMTLYAQWIAQEIVMSFDAAEGILAENRTSQSIVYDSIVSELPIPSAPEGYDFVGWKNDGNLCSTGATVYSAKSKINTSNYMISDGKVKFTATYKIKNHTVTFDYNDGSYRESTLEVSYGSTLERSQFPTEDDSRNHKQIIGWTMTNGSGVRFAEEVKEDIRLYAIWDNYKVFEFCERGDTVTETHKVFESDKEGYTLYEPTRRGYTFEGWYTSGLYTGLPVTEVNYYTSTIKYYAKWNGEEYTITFVSNGGNDVDDMVYGIESDDELPTVTKENYTFVGWCKNANLSDTPIKRLAYGTSGDMTLYAAFRGDDKRVTLNADGGRVSSSSVTVEYGASFDLPVPIKENYAFIGWFDSSDHQVTDRDGKSNGVWEYVPEETDLYAHYGHKYYVTLTFNMEEACTVNVREYYVEGEEVTLTVQTNEGYNYLGLYYANDRLCTEEAQYTFLMPASDVTFTVKHEPKIYTVTLDADGGFCSAVNVKVAYGESFNVPVAFKQKYEFDGWSYEGALITDANGGSKAKWTLTHNITVLAIYHEGDSDVIGIFNAASLQAIADEPSANYALVSNIDLNAFSWVPFAFSGTLNGNGFAIQNLYIASDGGNTGLFTSVSGTVKNLILENADINSSAYESAFIGGVCGELTGTLDHVETDAMSRIIGDVGRIGGLVGKNSGTITNCVNRASVTAAAAEDDYSAGGIAAWHAGGTISNSKNYGAVSKKYYAGGVIGYCTTESVSGLENYGAVSGEICIGGVIGYLNKMGTYTLTTLTNSGAISGKDNVGGVFGKINNNQTNDYNYNNYTLTLRRSTNSGSVIGENNVGGIVGYLYANHTRSDQSISMSSTNLTNTADITGVSSVGGLIGYAYLDGESTISNSSSSATITAEYFVGGLVGNVTNLKLDASSNEGTAIVVTGYQTVDANYYAYAGGYAGRGYSVTNCNNEISITYTSIGGRIGGIAGYSDGVITNCTNAGDIIATKSSCVGGIAGELNRIGTYTLTTLTNSGAISGKDNVGGVFGKINNNQTNNYNYNNYTLTLSRSTNKGSVIGTNNVGGIVGYLYANHTRSDQSISMSSTNLTNTADITGVSSVGGLFGYVYFDATSNLADYTQSGAVNGTGGNVGILVGSNTNLNIAEE